MKANGLMRAEGKRFFARVMAAGAGPLSNRKDMNVSAKWAFANTGGTAEIFSSLSCFDGGQRLFYFGGVYYEAMAIFKIICSKLF